MSAAPRLLAADAKSDRREELYSLLGKLPARDYKVSAKHLSTEDRGTYTLERLVLDLNGIELAPAFFAKPKNRMGRLPTVLFNHSHGGGYHIGKTEFTEGREYLSSPPYAEFLTSLGYNALCFDTWIFGERATRTELDTFKEMLWRGRVLWGMMVFDSIKAVDYLVSRPDVDAERLGTVGISMGSNALESTEADLEVLRLPFAEAVQWVMDGKITDVISCAGLLKVHMLLAAGAI